VPQEELARTIAKHTGGRVLKVHIPVAPIHLAGDLCEAICVPFEIDPPLHRRRVDFWTKNRSFSIEKARRRLGYAPRVDVDEGIALTAAAYRQAGWL
jgi:nucleoside-diphosphate-sugar epimerase